MATDVREERSEATGQKHAAARERLYLVSLFAIALLINFDIGSASIVGNVFGTELRAGLDLVQWFVNAYILALTAGILAAGLLVDKRGSAWCMRVGLTLFATASLACLIASGPETVVVARFVQGLGAALIIPSTMADISLRFGEPKRRARTISIIAIGGGIGLAISPIAAALLISAGGWRSVYLVNLPVAAVAFLPFVGASRPKPSNGYRALLRSGLLLVGFFLLAKSLIEAPETSGAGLLAVQLAAGCALVAVFMVVDVKSATPSIPAVFYANSDLLGFCWIAFLSQASAFAVLFLFPPLLIDGLGLTVAEAGLRLSLITVPLLLTSLALPKILASRPPRSVTTWGLSTCCAGLGVLSVEPSYATFAFPILGIAFALLTAPVSLGAINSVEPTHAGGATGMLNTCRQAGALVGVALAGVAVWVAAPERSVFPGLPPSHVQSRGAWVVPSVVVAEQTIPTERITTSRRYGNAISLASGVFSLVTAVTLAISARRRFAFVLSRGARTSSGSA